METLKTCASCGAPIELSRAVNGVVECAYCHSRFTVARSSDKDAVAFLEMGEHDLDVGEFDNAYTSYAKAAERDKTEPEAYFGMALAEFKVRYLKDEVNGRLQPICYDISEKVFKDNQNYRKATSFATPEQRGEYEARASEIDAIRKEFYKLKAKDIDYDCFICVKVTDNDTGLRTRDYKYADELYFALRGKGYKPFFSERELVKVSGADYEAHILYALYSSESMIVVCSDESYLRTKWVKNEYTRFLRLMGDEEKESDSITIAYIGSPIERLPGKNGKIQSINLESLGALESAVTFVETHLAANMRPVDIARRDYGAASVARKSAVRTGVTKRNIDIVKGADIVVSDDTKINIALDFLRRREFTAAKNWCKGIIAEQPMSGRAYWLYFLAENECSDNYELSSGNGHIRDFTYFEKAISCTGDKGVRQTYYNCLVDRVRNNHDITAYCEYIALPESDDRVIEELTSSMYSFAYGNKNCMIFDAIINTVKNTDRYIQMNLDFARLIGGDAAVKYYKNVLDADNGHKEALYFVFQADKGDMFEYCSDPKNQQTVTDELYSFGFNDYATKMLFDMCIARAESRIQNSLQLFDYLITLIPKDKDALLIDMLHTVLDTLFATSNSKYAKKYIELCLSLDNYDHTAFFYRLLANHGFVNPLEIITLGDDIIGDPDFYSAINSFTEKNKGGRNFYLDVNSEMRRLREKLGGAVDIVVKEIYLSRTELADCYGKITGKMSELAQQYLNALLDKYNCDSVSELFELCTDVTEDTEFKSAHACAIAGTDPARKNVVEDIKARQPSASKRNAKNKRTRGVKLVFSALPVGAAIIFAFVCLFSPATIFGDALTSSSHIFISYEKLINIGIPAAVVGFVVYLTIGIILAVKNKTVYIKGALTSYARIYMWGALTYAGIMTYAIVSIALGGAL